MLQHIKLSPFVLEKNIQLKLLILHFRGIKINNLIIVSRLELNLFSPKDRVAEFNRNVV